MKIGLLITDLQIGGTPTVVRELAIRLPASVISLAPGGEVADQIHAAGRDVLTLNVRYSLDLSRAVSRLVRLIHAERFDTIFSFLIHANTIAAVASLFCRNTRFLQSIQTTQPTPRWHWKLQSIVHHAADTIVVPSPSTATAAIDWSNIPRAKLSIIGNATELSRSTGVPPVSFRRNQIGFIGRLDPIKRLPDLIESLQFLPPHHLHIFGEGNDRRRIEQTIARLKLADRITLHGRVASPETALNQIDTLVLPSAAEGFGLVLIEAMAAGVPVVATDVPGIRDVVTHDETGLLVPVGNPRAIADAISRLANDDTLRHRLIANGLQNVADHYTWDRVLPQYRHLLDAYDAIPL